jgi:hypothetical protein
MEIFMDWWMGISKGGLRHVVVIWSSFQPNGGNRSETMILGAFIEIERRGFGQDLSSVL